jgi:capsular exopolysaccharide synthesis family protein
MPEDTRNEPLQLTRILAILRRRAWILILCIVIGAAAAYFVSHRQQKKYSATAAVLFQQDQLSQQLFGFGTVTYEDPTTESATNVTLASQPVIAAHAAGALGHGLTRTRVSSEISIAAAGASDVVDITATDPSPALAATIANTYVTQLVDYLQASAKAQVVEAAAQLQGQINKLRATSSSRSELLSLETRLSELDVLAATQTGDIQIADPALVPTSPSSPHVKRSTALGLIAGLLVGVLAVFLAERMDRRLREPNEATEVFGLPILGMIPSSRSLSRSAATKALAPTAAAEPFRLLRAQLRYFNVDREIKSILVTSAAPGDGKTTVAWNLARTAASLAPNSSVLLVDADLRRSSVAAMTKLEAVPGLAETLTHGLPFHEAVRRFDVEGLPGGRPAQLDILTAGAPAPNPSELLESQTLRRLVERLHSTYDLVILDTPPTAAVSDAIPLMTQVSGILVVVRLRNTRRDDATRLHQQLVSLGAPALGLVLNDISAATLRYKGYAGYSDYAPPRSAPLAGRPIDAGARR